MDGLIPCSLGINGQEYNSTRKSELEGVTQIISFFLKMARSISSQTLLTRPPFPNVIILNNSSNTIIVFLFFQVTWQSRVRDQ